MGAIIGFRDVAQADVGGTGNVSGDMTTRTLGIRLDGTHVGPV
ncbi:hypothetical protein HMPREF9588_00212 [Cutibacterium acnes HL025PA2]|nr:hypothetical protein HMPREF9588_00212 [Cutibacterium acnes HL025PA2]